MPDRFRGRVERVIDGDTFEVVDGVGERVKVRLWGVDAPEEGQPYGPAATAAAKELAEGKPCVVTAYDVGPYGRIIGRVRAGEYDVGRSLVYNGVAWHSRKYDTSRQLVRLEKDARREEKGLWQQEAPVPPWQWRDATSRRTPASGQPAPQWGAVVFTVVVTLLLALLSLIAG